MTGGSGRRSAMTNVVKRLLNVAETIRSVRIDTYMVIRRFSLICLSLLAFLIAPAVRAEAIVIGRTGCYAVTPQAVADAAVTQLRFACTGAPERYQRASLWVRADPAPITRQGDGFAILVHQTRFDRLTTFFLYRDGHVVRQDVRRGNYGDRWRVGAQVVFVAPAGADLPVGVVLRFDHLASVNLMRARMMPVSLAGRDMAIASALIGAALILLLVGAIYNFSLAAAVKRQYLAWHGAWAASVFVWGMLWSQFALIFVPGVAGTTASQLSTFLACTAVLVATLSAVTAFDPKIVPRWLRMMTLGFGVTQFLLGMPATFFNGAILDILGPLLSLTLVCDLIAVSASIAIAWRAGNAEARDLALAWAVPMLTLGITEYVDLGEALFGGGSQIAVLFACAFQTVWLSIAATLRLARLRIERDAARAAESEMGELANRDPLTGLLNRRGFIARTRIFFGNPANADVEFALLLIDVDHFKSINDTFGHETGDDVLCAIAARLKLWERELCLAGRLGGEEFVLAVSGLNAFALGQFADLIRVDLGACDHGEVSRHRRVTVSIGVARGHAATTFQRLYGMADRALYEAKHGGRDRIAFHGVGEPWREAFAQDQMAFEWGGGKR
jgi:diguanylate cyclase (GGDEF)-like protein